MNGFKVFIWVDVFKSKTWESEAKQLDFMTDVLSIKKSTQVFWNNGAVKLKDFGFNRCVLNKTSYCWLELCVTLNIRTRAFSGAGLAGLSVGILCACTAALWLGHNSKQRPNTLPSIVAAITSTPHMCVCSRKKRKKECKNGIKTEKFKFKLTVTKPWFSVSNNICKNKSFHLNKPWFIKEM